MEENNFTRAERLANALHIIPAQIKVAGRSYSFTLDAKRRTASYSKNDCVLVSVTEGTSYDACMLLIDSYLRPKGFVAAAAKTASISKIRSDGHSVQS